MKPLPAAPLTDEDFDTYVRIAGHYRKHGHAVLTLYDTADRRDAELMLEYEWLRRHGIGTSPLRREICRWSHL